MKPLLFILSFLFSFQMAVHAQDYESLAKHFKTYLSYYSSEKIAETNNLVYAVTNGSLLSYNKTDNSIFTYSKQTGLSDNKITQIAYNPTVNSLLIVYSNGNIDLMDEAGNSYNISHLMTNTNFNFKTVNQIDIYNQMAYLSMQFGVLALDMEKKEIKDTYRIVNDTVYSVSVLNNAIYAATSKGVYKASLNDNLVDTNNWHAYSITLPASDDKIIKTVVFDNKLCFLVKNEKVKGVYYLDNDNTTKNLLTNNTLVNIKMENGQLIAHSNNNAYIYSSWTQVDKLSGTINDISSYKDQNTYWIAAGTGLIKGIKKNNSGGFDVLLSEININSPRNNNFYAMVTQGNKLLAVAGGKDHDRYWRQGFFSTFENEEWSLFDQSKIEYYPGKFYPQDFTAVTYSQTDPTDYFISSYGEGLFEIKDNEVVAAYNIHNSPLEGIDGKNQYVRISDIAFDSDNNLWMTNCQVESPIKVLKSDGTWAGLSYKNYINKPQIMDKILITSKGHKWLNFPYTDQYNNKAGILIFQDANFEEDEENVLFLSSLQNSSGEDLGTSTYRCMVEDKKGYVWVGTNKGVVYTPVAANAIENPSRFYFSRITREGDSGLYYFLDGDQVNTIAVDGGNRKWIGTQNSGVFLVSEDAQETIYNFTTENSPLLSDCIVSLAINDMTGEVFIGTDKGLVSFMGEATEGKSSYSDVSVYPNPVRPEYEDRVTITGLMSDSNVKITNVSGQLIYQAKSLGGQLVWNCRNYKGNRVATGIYLVIAANADGNESVVTKIMVVK